MTERVVIPTGDQKGLNAHLAEHFGRAPYYAIVDFDQNGQVAKVKTVSNTGEHSGGIGSPHDTLLQYHPNAIIAYGMGPRGLTTFQNMGIAVLKANANTVGEVVEAYKKGGLLKLTEGCEHAHHHDHFHNC